MFTPRFRLALFAAALLLTAALQPAAAVPSQPSIESLLPITTSMKCGEIGTGTRCCTDTAYCCYWPAGGGSPICY